MSQADARRLSGIATAALRQSIRRHSNKMNKNTLDQRAMQQSILNMTKVLIKEQIMEGHISQRESAHLERVRWVGGRVSLLCCHAAVLQCCHAAVRQRLPWL